MAEQKLNLLKIPAGFVAQTAHVRRRSCGATFPRPHFEHPAFTTPQMTLGLNLLFPMRCALLMGEIQDPW